MAVDRVRKSAAPRAVMKPDELPPTPSPPPSDRCIRITPTRAVARTDWTISRKANMCGFLGSEGGDLGERARAFNRSVIRRGNDWDEIGRLEAGATDERAVHVGDAEDFPRVRRLDRAPIQDPHLSA